MARIRADIFLYILEIKLQKNFLLTFHVDCLQLWKTLFSSDQCHHDPTLQCKKKETTKPIINHNNVTSVNDTANLMFSLLQTNLKPWNFNPLYSTIEIHVYLNPVNTHNGTKIVINNLHLQFVTTNTYHKFWTLIIADFFGTSVYGTIS